MSKRKDVVALATGMRGVMTDAGIADISLKGGCIIIYVDSIYEVAEFAAEFGTPMHEQNLGAGMDLLYVESAIGPDVVVRCMDLVKNITNIEEFIKLHNEALGLEY